MVRGIPPPAACQFSQCHLIVANSVDAILIFANSVDAILIFADSVDAD
jgi:hypothetical protein